MTCGSQFNGPYLLIARVGIWHPCATCIDSGRLRNHKVFPFDNEVDMSGDPAPHRASCRCAEGMPSPDNIRR